MSPPPGYIPYGSSVVDAGRFQGIGGLRKAMIVLLWIYLPLQVIAVIDLARWSRQARRFLDGTISEQSFRDSVRVSAGSVVGLLVIPIAVLTMIWMFRMSANLRRLGRPGQTWVPGWAIGAWFVPPCVVYAVPWLMFKELWKGSDPATRPGDPWWKQNRVSPLVTWWWVLYGLIGSIGTLSSFSLLQDVRAGETIRARAERFRDAAASGIVFTLIAMVTTVVYIRLVTQLSNRHMQSIGEA